MTIMKIFAKNSRNEKNKQLAEIATAPSSPIKEIFLQLCKNKGAMVSLVVLSLLILLTILAPIVSPYSPIVIQNDELLVPPMWLSEGSFAHVFGTDAIGRDLLSRLIYGARLSIVISLFCVVISTLVGVTLGLISGYFRGTTDLIFMRIVDILMAIPGLLLAMAIVAILGPSLLNASISIAITQIPSFIRITRAATLTEGGKDYVMASKLSGASVFRILFLCILPNCIAPILVNVTLNFSAALLDIAALGFLGLGAQPPTPEWGSMLSDAMTYMRHAWWLVIFPGLAILISVLSLNILGDGLRDALDPKMKR